MTIGEVASAVAGFRFVGGFSLWKPTIELRRGPPALLWLGIRIPRSEDLTCLAMHDLNTGVSLDAEALSRDQRDAAVFIAEEFRKFFLHEFYESILVHGVKKFDPHEPDAHHPGAL